MHRYKNIAVTGAKQAGKSTLAGWLLEQMEKPWTGFRTVRYALTEQGPLYEITDLQTGESAPISHLTGEGIRGISETFENFGAQLLEKILGSAAPVVLLDEIGRFERSSPLFLAGLQKILDSEKTVIAVLKQEDIPHIAAIKARTDTLLIDLDGCSREDARKALKHWLKKP